MNFMAKKTYVKPAAKKTANVGALLETEAGWDADDVDTEDIDSSDSEDAEDSDADSDSDVDPEVQADLAPVVNAGLWPDHTSLLELAREAGVPAHRARAALRAGRLGARGREAGWRYTAAEVPRVNAILEKLARDIARETRRKRK